MTDTIEIGPTEPADDPADDKDIVYFVGPSQLRRIAGVVAVPTALGLASLVIAVASLMVVDPASEIGDISVLSGAQNSLIELRWSSGLRTLSALVALTLAIVAVMRLIGKRAEVRVGTEMPEADDESTLDDLEDSAIAGLLVPVAWQSMIVGSAIVVSLLSLALNAASFGYALAAHIPAQQIGSSF